MSDIEKLATVMMMQKYGGDFVKTLAALMLIADHDNLHRIEMAWPEYLRHYKDMAEREVKTLGLGSLSELVSGRF